MHNIAAGISFAKKYDKDFFFIKGVKNTKNSPAYTEYDWIVNKFKEYPKEITSDFVKIIEDREQTLIDIDKYSKCKNVVFIGIFQSPKYYDRNLVQSIFGNTEEDNKRIKEKYGNLSDYVSLSVRRTDFLNYSSTFITPSKEWYKKCYKKYFDGKLVMISGDDYNYCKNNLLPIFGDKAFILKEDDAVETLKIKQCCKSHIIPPSTYSWWSAYLSGEDSTVVAPNIWYTKESGINSEEKYENNWIKENL